MEFSRNDTKVIKGIAIILMLYHHLFFFPDRVSADIVYLPVMTIGGTSLAYFIGEFGKLCVALFLFLGGYGTYISCRKSSDNNIYISETILNKIKGLYQEYWKVFLVFVPICMIAGVSRVEKNLETFLWNLSGLSTSYCGEWWFFTPYVGLLVTFPAAYRILKKNEEVLIDLVGVVLFDIFARYVLTEIYGYIWAAKLQKSLFWNVFSETITNGAPFYMGCIFAKYDLLGKIKQRFLKHGFGAFLSMALLVAVFYMRHQTGIQYDYLYAPVFTASAIVVLERFPWKLPRYLMQRIGEEGTTIWLVHSIYCYLLCQRIVYLPRYTILICAWLLMMSYSTSLLLKKGNNLIMDCIKENLN